MAAEGSGQRSRRPLGLGGDVVSLAQGLVSAMRQAATQPELRRRFLEEVRTTRSAIQAEQTKLFSSLGHTNIVPDGFESQLAVALMDMNADSHRDVDVVTTTDALRTPDEWVRAIIPVIEQSQDGAVLQQALTVYVGLRQRAEQHLTEYEGHVALYQELSEAPTTNVSTALKVYEQDTRAYV